MSASAGNRLGSYGQGPAQYVVIQYRIYVRGRLYNIRCYYPNRFFPPQPFRPQPQPKPVAPKPTPTDQVKPVIPKPAPIDPPKPIEPKPAPIDQVKPIEPKPAPIDQVKPVEPKPTPIDPPKPVEPKPVSGGGGVESDRQAKLERIRGMLDAGGKAALDRLGSKLEEKDLKTGKTTLDHLNELAEKGVDTQMTQHGISKEKILSELLQELAEPGIIHQSNRGTCAATTVQYYLATNHPAEYARVVTAFMNGGKAEMASGKTFLRDPDSLRSDSSTRNNIDRMFQTAAMDRSEFGDYQNATDRHVTGAGGMTQDDVTNLVNDFTAGKDGRFQTVMGNDESVLSRIAQSTAKGIEVPVGLRWSFSGRDAAHELLVTKIENGQVYLRNPWGKDEKGLSNNGPMRNLVNDKGDITMPLAEFQSRLLESSLS